MCSAHQHQLRDHQIMLLQSFPDLVAPTAQEAHSPVSQLTAVGKMAKEAHKSIVYVNYVYMNMMN